MPVIGSYAGIVFEINDLKNVTYSDFKRETTPRWDTHDILQNKPLPEFRGPGVDEITLQIKFRADFGVDPEKEMAKLREFARKGHTSLFIRGNQPISVNHWVITKATEVHKVIDNKGNVISMDVELTLMEYPKSDIQSSKKTIKPPQVKIASSNSSLKPIGKMIITVKSVHIRSGPGVNYKVLGYAFKGDTLTVYGEKNGWYSLGGGKYITANNKYSKFVKG
ncbi:phage tail protein [Ureibacillus thermosphaericus]|uniref:Phage protein U n=1 Tax=Ureibacillus thermosphaericus TaxID=51173 RepID=A0A840PRN5_URETH|nr:phage tail protein [Ureibacillus thermosphaericus]MBB5148663.1 phage protein U [Ureibacillus thermosphaericus]NKZ31379.1 SH3 domain-containing protein [Ureibacillus thermosphaericus]